MSQPDFDCGENFHVDERGKNIWLPLGVVMSVVIAVVGATVVAMRAISSFEMRTDRMDQKIDQLTALVSRRVVTREQLREFVHDTKAANPTLVLPDPDQIAIRISEREK